MVSGVFSTVRRCGEYGANFLFGTGSEVMGKEIGQAIKARSRAGISLPKAVGAGFTKGFNKTNAQMAASGGFLKNLIGTFKATPGQMSAGWKSGTGILSKLKGAMKPLGKLMPFAMNALWFAQSIPDIVGRTKEEGIWGGIKEAGKALLNMGVFSLAASVGSAAFGMLGMFALPIAASMLTAPIIGKSFREKKAEEEAAKQEAQANNNPFLKQSQVGQKLDITSAA
ncbi:MAG: hypothetical protein K6E29_04990 [Cyanobacteria bacterium RUI128]|nr:hypothetical protein [Cyanobacteria bacterium RUI128]